jgi:hypothetical protein
VVVVVADGYDAAVCAANIASHTLLVCEIYETLCRASVYSRETYIRAFVMNTTNQRTGKKNNTAKVILSNT